MPRSQAIRLNVEPETHGVSPEAMPHGGTRGDLTGGMSQALLQLCQHAQPTAPSAAGGEAPREPGCPMAPPCTRGAVSIPVACKIKIQVVRRRGRRRSIFHIQADFKTVGG